MIIDNAGRATMARLADTHEVIMPDEVVLTVIDHEPYASADWDVPAVVLVHGWCGDSTEWEDLVPGFRQHARVLLVELRGHGSSPDGDSHDAQSLAAHDAQSLAADVAAAVDARDIRGVVLIGHSAGGEVVVQLAVDRPELVRVTVDPAYGVQESDRPRQQDVSRMMALGDPTHVVADYFGALNEPPLLAARHRALALAVRPSASRAMFDAINLGPHSWHFKEQSRRMLARVEVTLLAVYRNEQRAEVGRRLAKGPDDAVLVYDTGHWPHQEYRDRFLADADAWVRRQLTAGAGRVEPLSARVVVTGETEEGRSVIMSVTVVTELVAPGFPQFGNVPIGASDGAILLPSDGSRTPQAAVFPPSGGYRFFLLRIDPVSAAIGEAPTTEQWAEAETMFPELFSNYGDDGLERTNTVDFGYLVSGTAVMSLGDGSETTLRAGAAFVQNGAGHRWYNPGLTPAVLAVVFTGQARA